MEVSSALSPLFLALKLFGIFPVNFIKERGNIVHCKISPSLFIYSIIIFFITTAFVTFSYYLWYKNVMQTEVKYIFLISFISTAIIQQCYYIIIVFISLLNHRKIFEQILALDNYYNNVNCSYPLNKNIKYYTYINFLTWPKIYTLILFMPTMSFGIVFISFISGFMIWFSIMRTHFYETFLYMIFYILKKHFEMLNSHLMVIGKSLAQHGHKEMFPKCSNLKVVSIYLNMIKQHAELCRIAENINNIFSSHFLLFVLTMFCFGSESLLSIITEAILRDSMSTGDIFNRISWSIVGVIKLILAIHISNATAYQVSDIS